MPQDEIITLADIFREADAERGGDLEAARARLRSARRICMIGCKAAKLPEWWWSNFYHQMCPEWTHGQIAGLIGVSRANVTRYIRQVRVGDEIYDELPNIK